MDIYEKLRMRLHSLVVFRALLSDKIVVQLNKLLSADSTNPLELTDAYCEFASALFSKTDNFSRYLLNLALEDENMYIKSLCRKKQPTETIVNAVYSELNILQELAAFDASAHRAALKALKLPEWKTESLNFAAEYRERIESLPRCGCGIYAKYHVFTVQNGRLVPVKHPDSQRLSELSGYEAERSQIITNTRALLNGKDANNVLLYGDAGTGKSSTVKAVANEFASEGLRLIEIKKNQLYQIPEIIDELNEKPLKFILFIDDLSFSTNDNDFTALKAILEGSVSGRASNLAIYATSNRRHLVKERFQDREGDEIHLADTVQELTSLSARFGLKVTFSRPDKELYCHIVENLALMHNIELPSEDLLTRAEAHAIQNGGRSPRIAKQFINQLLAEL